MRTISDSRHAVIDRFSTAMSIPADRELCRQGRLGNEVFLVTSGTVEVLSPSGAIELAAPTVIGEAAMGPALLRNATVTARTEVCAQVFSRREWLSALSHPEFEAYVTELTAGRTM